MADLDLHAIQDRANAARGAYGGGDLQASADDVPDLLARIRELETWRGQTNDLNRSQAASLKAAMGRERAALKAADTFAEDAHKAGAERDEALTAVRRVRELAQELQKSSDRGYVSHVAEDVLLALDGE